MFNLQKNGRPSIAPVAGQRVYSRLINNVQSHVVQLDVTGTVTIATADATAILNRGSLWACFDEVGISENGRDTVLMHGRVLRALSEQAAPSPLSAVRLTSTAQAAYTLKESARIEFAHPYAIQPRETAYREHDPRQLLEVFVKLNSNAAALIATAGGGGTVTLTNLSVNVTHIYDGVETVAPFFIPHVRQLVDKVTGANAAQPFYIKTPRVLRGMVLSQEDSDIGEVSDIINAVVLRGDQKDWIGPSAVSLEDLIAASEYEFGGASGWNVGDAHLGFNFQTFGRLSNCLNPNQDTNLRFELDVQPSVTGTGTSQLRLTLIELWTDAALTQPLTIPV